MAGTLEGGRKTRETNYKKYGADYYKQIGAAGGKASGTGGFYNNSEKAREAGRKGGLISKRGPKIATETTENIEAKAKLSLFNRLFR